MYAVIQVGNFQYKVSQGDVIKVPRLVAEEGKTIPFEKVLLYSNGNDVRVGQPLLKDVKVSAKVLGDARGKKTLAFKFRRRKDSRSKVGHRQDLTVLSIAQISA
ncbi:MAG: 50S ribosomal protein L21 [Candidatus Omnitrophica bacterium]|nr:50S ribosomal protein L21 [Candidatus Omnitrophota bacterium]